MDLCARLGAAFALGSIIGFERQLRQGLGGIRVYALVSLGSALFVLSGVITPTHDYSRAAAQVISGIGFLCAGMIFKHGISVRGLNQAATIWTTSAVGVLCGAGLLLPATIGAAGVLFVHLVMRSFSQELESKILDSPGDLLHYRIEVECRTTHSDAVRLQLSSEIPAEAPIRLVGIATEQGSIAQHKKLVADYLSTTTCEDEMQRIVGRIGQDEKVSSIKWMKMPPGEENLAQRSATPAAANPFFTRW